GLYPAIVLIGLQVFENDLANEVRWRRRLSWSGVGIGLGWGIGIHVQHLLYSARRLARRPSAGIFAGGATLDSGSAHVDRLVNPRQRLLPPEHFQGFEQGRRVLAAADGYADRLKHLSWLDAQLLGGGAERLVERVVFEFRVGQHIPRARENLYGHLGVAFLRNQFRRIVRREFVHKEEVGHSEHVAEQLDTLPDQYGYLPHLA